MSCLARLGSKGGGSILRENSNSRGTNAPAGLPSPRISAWLVAVRSLAGRRGGVARVGVEGEARGLSRGGVWARGLRGPLAREVEPVDAVQERRHHPRP